MFAPHKSQDLSFNIELFKTRFDTRKNFPELVSYSAPSDLHRRAAYSICESSFLIHRDVYHDLFVPSW